MCKNVVIVGDTLQLPNVVTGEDKEKLDAIVAEFDIPSGYDCAGNSFYSRYVLFCPMPRKHCFGNITVAILVLLTFVIVSFMAVVCSL